VLRRTVLAGLSTSFAATAFVVRRARAVFPDHPVTLIVPFAASGSAANLAEHCIKKVEVQEYAELGMEAIWRIEVVDFPAFIVMDDKGNDFFKELNLG
jgi:tartrate dehydratase beta subunit/fumarate hydratase class I family protein